jgi:hypothetical protein
LKWDLANILLRLALNYLLTIWINRCESQCLERIHFQKELAAFPSTSDEGQSESKPLKFTTMLPFKKKAFQPGMWYMSVIPTLGRLNQEDCEFEISLIYVVRPCLKRRKKEREREETKKKMYLITLFI